MFMHKLCINHKSIHLLSILTQLSASLFSDDDKNI